MSKVLRLCFTGYFNKISCLKIPHAKDNLTGSEVAAVMDSIVASDIIHDANGRLTGKSSASVLDVKSTKVNL